MSVSERQNQLVISLALKKLSEEEFLRQFPASPEERPSLGLRVLSSALQDRSADTVESGVILGSRFGMGPEYIQILERLATEDWHQKHEDIVFALGKLRSPTSVEPLFRASEKRHEYLEYNDQYSLRSKIIHALGNIGTLEACARLDELAQRFGDPELIAKIGRQLRALVETSPSEEVQARAREALTRLPPDPEDEDE